jgi:tRNA dimethylallyltransferase
MVGQVTSVLVEKFESGYCFGRTRNFKNIKFASLVDLTGQIVLVKITSCYAWGLSGQLAKVVIILGPTSTGKTKLTVELAEKFKGEIVSADSRQVYKGMDIGTGKDLKEYGQVPYHLINVADPGRQFTVAQWQKLAVEKIDDILKRGKLPIICGGTGLYISALVQGFNFAKAQKPKSPKTREKLSILSLQELLTLLKKIDPKTYQIIDQKNRRRVQRALEIYYETGIPKSEQPRNQKPPYDFFQIGLNFPKEVLRRRITQRLTDRLEKEGMINEVRRLHRQGVSWRRLEEFGLEYRYVALYLQKKINHKQMVEQLNKAINDFAKRQMTWFKRDKSIRWLSLKQGIASIVSRFLSL